MSGRNVASVNPSTNLLRFADLKRSAPHQSWSSSTPSLSPTNPWRHRANRARPIIHVAPNVVEEEIENFLDNFRNANSDLAEDNPQWDFMTRSLQMSWSTASMQSSPSSTGLSEASSALGSFECPSWATNNKYWDYVMGESGCTLTVLDVADALQTNFAFISGGRSLDGAPVITFPDVPATTTELSDDHYRNMVTYLTSIPTKNKDRLQDVDIGFLVVVDRRQNKWSSVKTLLMRIADYFPGLIQEVLVLRPSGFFQRTFADMGFKFVRDDFKFKVLMCSSVDDLHSRVTRDQLTSDLDGSLEYNHQEWIQHRAALEKFSSNTSQIGESLRELCKRLQETEFPNDVTSTEILIRDHQVAHDQLKEELTSTIGHGRILLGCFKTVRGSDGEEVILVSADLPANKLAHVTAVERLIVQLEETDINFDDFWSHHDCKLQQCLQFRRFEEDFRSLQANSEQHLLSLQGMIDTGDTVQRVDALIMELHDFEEESKTDIASAEALRASGERFIEDDHYAVDCIRPKCIELQRICEQYKEILRRRHEILARSKDLQDRVDRANKWCTRGVDLLAAQQLPTERTLTSVADAQASLQDVEQFLGSAQDVQLSNPSEFKAMFESIVTVETREQVRHVLQRIEDVQNLCEKRRRSLRALAEPPPRPVQTVMPEPVAPGFVRHGSGTSGSGSDRDEGKRERRLSRPGINGLRGKVEVLHPGDEGFITPQTEEQLQQPLRNPSDSDSHSSPSELVRDFDTLLAKRRHVMKELIETERGYVSELKAILEGYSDQMSDPQLATLLPEELIGQRETLFGNMRQIYEFHSNVFLKQLEACRDTPALIGRCFVEREEELQMYSRYCQNKMASDALRRKVGDSNPFFKECQRRLSHRLPLSAYLLKPVQRVTKYQLILKEMIKYVQSDTVGCDALKEALQSMLGVLKYVNDLLHQGAIVGYDDLGSAGRLLMQGSFSVWTEHKRDLKIQNLRFKPLQRHIFLYEQILMFCKKRDEPNNAEKASYAYKQSVKMSAVGLTEKVRGDKDGRKLEVWTDGRAEAFIIQAPTLEVKAAWVSEIKRVLLCQFDQIKDGQYLVPVDETHIMRQAGLGLRVPRPHSEPPAVVPLPLEPRLRAPSLPSSRSPPPPLPRRDSLVHRMKQQILTHHRRQKIVHPRENAKRKKNEAIIDNNIMDQISTPNRQSPTLNTTDDQIYPTNVSVACSPPPSIDSDNSSRQFNDQFSDTSSICTQNSTEGSTGATPSTKDGGAASDVHVVMRRKKSYTVERFETGDDNGWSSDEFEDTLDNSHSGSSRPPSTADADLLELELQRYSALADYQAVDSNELSLTEGDLIEVLKLGSQGWWYVRDLASGEIGWAPASYMEVAKRASTYSTQSTVSSGSTDSGGRRSDSLTSSSAYATASSGFRSSVCSHSSNNSSVGPGGKAQVISETLV